MRKILSKNYFIILILITLLFSLLYPTAGRYLKENGVLTPLTFLAMFASGLGLSLDNIKGSFRDYGSILYSFGAVYFIFPAVALALFTILGISRSDIYIGGMILAAQSSTLSSAVVLTMSAGGNVPLALIITIINNVSSAFVTPVMLRLLLSAGEEITFDLGAMIVKLVTVLILPVVLAQVLRLFTKSWIDKINPYRKKTGQLVVLFFVLTGAASASPQLKNNIGVIALIIGIVAVLHIIMLLFSILYSKIFSIEKKNKTAVMFCSSQKTLPASLLIWGNFFSSYTLAPLFIVSYHMVQLVIDSMVVNRIQTD